MRLNEAPIRDERAYVLLWVTAQRRLAHNAALDHAVFLANSLGKPLLILEALRLDYPYASERLHRFILDGMADDVEAAQRAHVTMLAYVEREARDARGLLQAVAARACVVVTDDYPCFFIPRMTKAAGDHLDVELVAVDGNGLVPMRVVSRPHATAHSFRREIQKLLPPALDYAPSAAPLDALRVRSLAAVDDAVLRRWPTVDAASLRGEALLASLPIDRSVPRVAGRRGGRNAGLEALDDFVTNKLARYGERSHPDANVASGLSPYLHFGYVGAHEIYAAVTQGSVDPARLVANGGSREGYYGLDPAREGFLDQLVTWRELGFNFCAHRSDYAEYASLPPWARESLAAASADERPYRYSEADLEAANTHDPLWNAAQRELRETGTIQNYLRMLWGKKILEWSDTPEEAWRIMIQLNDKWALDGRDPNSYSGIGWVFGRFDRPWGPRRPVFGTVRYMTSASAAKKLHLSAYLARFGSRGGGGGEQTTLQGLDS